MKKDAYLAICYRCNEHCQFCPCSLSEKKESKEIKIDELMNIVDGLSRKGCLNITLSGGEPTLHSDFIQLIAYIQNKGMSITVLTNGERLSDKKFIENLNENIDLKKIRFITTFHSHNENEHEKANGTPGSFKRSLEGLKQVYKLGAKVEIKHCITIHNLNELSDFYIFFDNKFDDAVNIQLCSVDYCGISREKLDQELLSFNEMKKPLEKMFDIYLQRRKEGSKRKLYAINMPLCACDVYYWSLLTQKKSKLYDGYVDPYTKDIVEAKENVQIDSECCKECQVADICVGTYKTAFEYFGKRLVKPYI